MKETLKEQRQATQTRFKDTLIGSFNDLFDVAHQDVLVMIRILEGRAFLLAQREKGWPGLMAGVDISLMNSEKTRLHGKRNNKLRCINWMMSMI